MRNLKLLTLCVIIILAVLSRFLPFPPNVAPVAAIALFGGAYFKNKGLALLLPVGIMLVSDLFIGLHSTLLFVYASFALIMLVGYKFLGEKVNMMRLVGASLTGSVLFYLITNFGVWLVSPYYPLTPAGLMSSYTMAIPFFHYTLLGDLAYSSALFGSYALLRHYVPQLQNERNVAIA
jgi:H+/gluconate symporter-like permease